jgi:Cu+-exporting ATPase
LLGLAATVEVNIDHPFARAIVTGARELGIGIAPARDARSIPGGGAEGHTDGHRVLLGSQTLLEREGVARVTAAESRGKDSHVAVAVDGELAGEIVLRDAARPGAPEVIAEIRALGVTPCLLSGDHGDVVAEIASEVGIQKAFGGLAPGQKTDLLQKWRQDHSGVAMVGDGINDAPALAAADVGIAFGPAADLARQTADVVILVEDLREVPRLFRLARRTVRIVRQNLGWAFGYNAVGILLAALGFLRPVIAAGAMVLSSVFVVGNSLRLQRPEPL